MITVTPENQAGFCLHQISKSLRSALGAVPGDIRFSHVDGKHWLSFWHEGEEYTLTIKPGGVRP